jgi:hypothetical protein
LRNLVGDQRIYISNDDDYELKFNRFMRFKSYWIDEKWSNLREVLLPNINILDGIASANNFDPLVTARYARWMEMLGELDVAEEHDSVASLLNLMGVGTVEYLSNAGSLGTDFKPIEGSYRVRWLPCAQYVLDGEQAWDLLTSTQADLERVVILESEEDNPETNCSTGSQMATVSIVEDRPNKIKMQVNTQASGWLVLSDQWYPGWTAEIDGEETSILRANYLFRAVKLPAGDHQVVWKYNPLSFRMGLLISTISWLVIGIIAVLKILRIWRNHPYFPA